MSRPPDYYFFPALLALAPTWTCLRSLAQVVVTSPYLRCIETAAAICLRLGSQTRLMVDLGLGEVYGPEIFGEEPQRTIRSSQEVKEP